MAKVPPDLFDLPHHSADAYPALEPIVSADVPLVVNGRDHESNVLWKSGAVRHMGTPGVRGLADENGYPNLQGILNDGFPR